MIKHKGGGFSYWANGRFSINEGQLPNIHVRYGCRPLGFYIALTRKLKFWKYWDGH